MNVFSFNVYTRHFYNVYTRHFWVKVGKTKKYINGLST